MNTTVQYHQSGRISLGTDTIKKIQPSLDKGFYRVGVVENPFGHSVFLEEVHPHVPDSTYKYAEQYTEMGYIETMFSPESKQIHKDLSMTLKIGMLFHGVQGTGKTTIMNGVAKHLINRFNAVVFIVDGIKAYLALQGVIKELRTNGDFLSVVVWDECEDDFRAAEGRIKSILDGMDSIDNSVLLCATNYVEKIPKTIVDRPSRFKFVYEIGVITDPTIVFDLFTGMNNKLTNPIPEAVLRKHVTKAMHSETTVDTIKHYFIDLCFERINLEVEHMSSDEEDEDGDGIISGYDTAMYWIAAENLTKQRKPIRISKNDK